MPTSISKQEKPAKPTPDYPLFAHATGRWAKKVKGKLHYFGLWVDPVAALRQWLAVKDDLLAGRTPAAGPKPKRTAKPKKHKDFPLWLHPSGRWCRKIRGRVHYFGKADNPQAALEKWLEQKDDLLAGRVPRPTGVTGVNLDTLANTFLTHKENLVQTGELRRSTFDEYCRILKVFIGHFGRHRLATDITPQDFEGLRAHLGKSVKDGPTVLEPSLPDLIGFHLVLLPVQVGIACLLDRQALG